MISAQAADPHPVGLRDAAVLEQRPRGRLLVGPDALLEGAAELRVVRLADQIVPLMVERRVEEELVVLDLEMLVLLADAALAEGDELLTLGQRAHGHGPLFECNRHEVRRYRVWIRERGRGTSFGHLGPLGGAQSRGRSLALTSLVTDCHKRKDLVVSSRYPIPMRYRPWLTGQSSRGCDSVKDR